ncbi:MAG: hypothetical protein Q9168_004353 [Polycauliona sp. 1 TL-2023]
MNIAGRSCSLADPALPQPSSMTAKDGIKENFVLTDRSHVLHLLILPGQYLEAIAQMDRELETKLYQNLVLLLALNKSQAEKAEIPPRDPKLLKDIQRSFLDAVAYICDYEKGGKTCTAAALTGSASDSILWLTENRQSRAHRQISPEQHVTRVLCALKESNGNQDEVSADLLRLIIRPSQLRIEFYRKVALISCQKCIKNVVVLEEFLFGEMTMESLHNWLLDLQKLFRVTAESSQHQIVRVCYEARNLPFIRILAQTKERGSDTRFSSFQTLHHQIWRLGKHLQCIHCMKQAWHTYPEVYNIKIRTLQLPKPRKSLLQCSSFTSAHQLITGSLPEQDITAYESAIRMVDYSTGNEGKPHTSIGNMLNTHKRTSTHAEIALLDHLVLRSKDNTSFMDGDRYIACSKAACYCCMLYVASMEQKDRVELCGGHNNLYLGWQPPANPSASGEESQTHRDILQRMVQSLQSALRDKTHHQTVMHNHPDSSTGVFIDQVTDDTTIPLQSLQNPTQKTKADLVKSELASECDNTEQLHSGRPGPSSELAESTDEDCSNCGAITSSRCSACKAVRYCSKACQSAQYHFHKHLCRSYPDFQHRPCEDVVRAILFPEISSKPRWVWVKLKRRLDEESGHSYQTPEVTGFLGNDNPFFDTRTVGYSPRRRCETRSMTFFFRDKFLKEDWRKNPSIVAATHGGLTHDWRGPGIWVGITQLALGYEIHEDLEIADMRDIVEYFEDYADTSIAPKSSIASPFVDGVQISCQGDMDVFGKTKYTAVSIPVQHSIFTVTVLPGQTSAIAHRIGEPWLIMQLSADLSWEWDGEAYVNQEATFLFRNIDPTANFRDANNMGWGWVPMRWQDGVGSVIVVRRDRTPLDPTKVEVVCKYCREAVGPLIENSRGSGLEHMTRDEVLAKITPEAFARYEQDYLLKQPFDRNFEEESEIEPNEESNMTVSGCGDD